MSQHQEQKQVSKQKHDSASPEESPQPAVDLRNEEQSQITDDLLDEIDSVLEVNAAEFVASYIQKGGQLIAFVGLLCVTVHYLRGQ